MSTIPIYTGQWTDWSRGAVLGNYRTFSVEDTLYIVGAMSAFLTVVGGSVWSIYAFFAHQVISSRESFDMIELQHRSTYRNTSTPTSAIIDAFWIYWWWKPWKLCDYRKARKSENWLQYILCCHTRPKRADRLNSRTCYLIIPAFMIFAGFIIAGILGTHIANRPYRANTVLIQDGLVSGNCGITLFDTSIEANVEFDLDASNRTHAAVGYARTCYSPASGVVDAISCSLFAKQSLKISAVQVGKCPFAGPATSFNESMCTFNTNTAAFALQTNRLNSDEHFGINARPEERVELSKLMVCSPLRQDGFTRQGSSHGAEAFSNNTVTEFLYGKVEGVADYTYSYNVAAAYDIVPPQITTLMHNASGPSPWVPVSNLSRSDADVVIAFLAQNSILYRNQVNDPIFQSSYPTTILANTGQEFTVYIPDNKVVVIGCTEQYSICNPLYKDRCTPMAGQVALLENINHIGLNLQQYVTAIRMVYMIADGNTYSSIDGIGPDALRMWSSVHDLVAPVIPDNQWQLEVRGWLESTLARWQAYAVNYAYNTAMLGPHGHVGFPLTNSTLDRYWHQQCRNQKVANIGRFQNVSIFGFSFTFAVGGSLIIFSLIMKPIIKACQGRRISNGRIEGERSKARRRAWKIDGKLQSQRIALQTADYYDLVGGDDDVPYLLEVSDLPLPFETTEVPHIGADESDAGWAATSKEGRQSGSASQDESELMQHEDTTDNDEIAAVSPLLVGPVNESDRGQEEYSVHTGNISAETPPQISDTTSMNQAAAVQDLPALLRTDDETALESTSFLQDYELQVVSPPAEHNLSRPRPDQDSSRNT